MHVKEMEEMRGEVHRLLEAWCDDLLTVGGGVGRLQDGNCSLM